MTRARQPNGALLGACAAGLTLGATLLLRVTTGLPSLGEVIGNGLALLMPGSLFGTLIDTLQERGRPLLLLGTSVLIVLVGAVLGRWLAGWSWLAVAPFPAAPAQRRGRALVRWLVPALGLWILTLPLVALGEGSLAVSATYSALADWLLLTGLLELLLGLPQQGGSQEGRLGPVPAGALPRRTFLAGAGALLGALSLGYLSFDVLSASSPPVPRLSLHRLVGGPGDQLPAGLTSTSDFYVVSKDLFGPPSVDASTWRLQVDGLHPYSLSYQELQAEPHQTQTQTLECISNPVGGTLISTGIWRGVQLNQLLQRAGVPSGTQQILFGCADGYTESLELDQATAPTTLLVDRLNGAPLTAAHGFPARVLVVDHYGMKNPKWLTSIGTSRQPYFGYWEQQGWNAGAYPRIFSRFDFPPGNSSLSAGRSYLLTGVAYAGTRGIAQVEVSVDGSRHWEKADLQTPLSPYTWTLWSFPWSPPSGFYTLRLRARDRQGNYQQPGSGQTYPNGANGYQQLSVLVR
ncbi:MAG TPA: molybdopterin-dependent oxidoreductase [Candidatus Dormibacteraeota bacterium]|nr:molybdopterin-dependent oxidoreductase [Candidatus Dormibacteraeota bacterium]